jgi:hypothetical protein
MVGRWLSRGRFCAHKLSSFSSNKLNADPLACARTLVAKHSSGNHGGWQEAIAGSGRVVPAKVQARIRRAMAVQILEQDAQWEARIRLPINETSERQGMFQLQSRLAPGKPVGDRQAASLARADRGGCLAGSVAACLGRGHGMPCPCMRSPPAWRRGMTY